MLKTVVLLNIFVETTIEFWMFERTTFQFFVTMLLVLWKFDAKVQISVPKILNEYLI